MAKKKIENYIFSPGIGYNENLYPDAYNSLVDNKTFIQKESIAYINQRILNDTQANLYPNATRLFEDNRDFIQVETLLFLEYNADLGAVGFENYTFNQDKCERDLKYVLDAIYKDLRYGGNWNTNYISSFYWIDDQPQIDGNRAAEVLTYEFVRDLITDYIFTGTAFSSRQTDPADSTYVLQDTSGPFAEASAESATDSLFAITVSVIANGLDNLAPEVLTNYPFANYTYNQAKCERDLGYVLDAYAKDLRYGGNEGIYDVAKKYWEGDTAQVDGDRQPETETHRWVSNLIQNYILKNVAATPLQQAEEQVIVGSRTYISGTAESIEQDTQTLILVIRNGLSSLPSLVLNGYSRIRFQGRWRGEDLLIITNTSANVIIYNFANSTTGGIVTFETQEDENFKKFLQISDSVTNIHLFANTESQNEDDEIQILVEAPEIRTRPYDFGTDAIERHRVGAPLSMLDADFEYGLQPTKWQAIGIQRGYPSIYEVPGTEFTIASITSDASVTTDGIGSSIITVTTITAHGIDAGIPITVIGLDQAVSGAARAEGSFVVIQTPANNQFTYYAKGKVATTSGTDISTAFSQIREGGFYTGAAIGEPTFYVLSQGTAGTITTVYITPIGTNRIAFTGDAPGLGAPIIGDFVPEGAQVTGVVGAGGLVTTIPLIGTYPAGTTTLNLSGNQSLVPNLGFDSGNGTLNIVETVVGNTITLRDPTAAQLIGSAQTYTGITGTNIVGTGQNAEFNVTRGASTSYVDVTVAVDGDGYNVGDTIKIAGDELGGIPGNNDLFITVTDVNEDSTNNIVSISFQGTANPIPAQTISAINDTVYTASASGNSATFNVTRESTTYTVELNNRGVDFAVNETITIPGNIFTSGATPTNDVTITVTAIIEDYTSIAQTSTSGTGTGALWDVQKEVSASDSATPLGSYSAVTLAAVGDSTIGDGYAPSDTITVAGTDLGGASPANDLVITVSTVEKNYYDEPHTSTSGTGNGATFTISKTGSVYDSVQIVSPGDGYAIGDTVTYSGSSLDATNTTNDLVITVSDVTKTYDGISQDTTTGVGINATFNVTKNGATYSVSLGLGGSGYANGDEVRILGTTLDGASPANDLVITVDTADGAGAIQTFSFVGSAGGTGAIAGFSFSGTAGGSGFIVNYTFFGEGGGTGGIQDFTNVGVANGTQLYTNRLGNNVSTRGSGATFTVDRASGSYISILPQFGNQGSLYVPGNRILVPGNQLGGATPTNDLEIIIDTVDGSGGVQTASASVGSVAVSGVDVEFYSTVLISENSSDNIPNGTALAYEALAELEVEFLQAHGIIPGGNFIISISSDDGNNNHNLAAGSYSAINVPTIDSIRFFARAPGQIDTTTPIQGSIYTRPDSFFVHRPFDGGVQLGTGGPQHGAQAIRQSKKYIRYQSGKGIMYTTGALFAPSYDILNLTASGIEVGSTITIELGDNDHGLQPGCEIRIIGAETSGYNHDYVVDDVVNERTFTVIAKYRLGSKIAILSPDCQVSTLRWSGAIVRAGIFDDQNGIFWEYDGQELAVVLRTGTKQVAGTVSIVPDSNLVTGSGTKFRDQLKAGDSIIIKGMTHVVSHVLSQTQMTVAPDFRGVSNVAGAKVSLVRENRIRQVDFNIDRLDGTGRSGYLTDITKMQMIGIQYSWYGAGFIDFMLRGSDGNFIYVHRIRNSNVNTEAFMRSGNLPVRYEVSNYGPIGRLTDNMTFNQDFVPLDSTQGFPDSGIVYIDNELIAYTSKTETRLEGCTRSADYGLFAQGADRVYRAGVASTHDRRTGVISLAHTTTPLISHWGSAFITDGGFDEDRGYIFSYNETGLTASTDKQTAFLIRLSPSVSNAVTGDLGERELLNRAQLLLQGIEITSDGFDGSGNPISGGIVVEGILNPKNYPTDPGSVNWSGLATPAQGGQPSFAQVAGGGSIQWSTGGPSATSSTLTHAPLMTVTVVTTPWNNTYTGNRSNYFYAEANSWEDALDNGLTVGTLMTPGGVVQNNTSVQGWNGPYNFSGVNYYSVSVSRQFTNRLGNNTNYNFQFGGNLVQRNFMYATAASFQASGVQQGTNVSATSAGSFPANTQVNNIQGPFAFGGVTYYTITFNNTFTGTLNAGSGTVTLEFVEPAFAQPGETVFSFIAQPGERSELDLAQLKELTNTTLGGRGTFPNGPDILAINVYKVSGGQTPSNIILRWGEAQA